MKIDSLTDLLLHELRDLYDAEQQLLEALPLMAKAAFADELKEAFQMHTEETKGQVERLEAIFKTLGVPAKATRCHAMAGLVKEAEELLKEEKNADPSVLDAGLIVAAQKVEHYEIAGYGSARAFAKILGSREAESLLQETLDEEGATDKKLTLLAESLVNLDAAESDAEMLEEAPQK